MKLLIRTFPNIPFFSFLYKLRWLLDDCQSVLDIGCGGNSPLALLSFSHMVGVDAYKPNIIRARKNKTHNQLIMGDIREIKIMFPPKSFDCVVALDVIEHLSKKDGMQLLKNMERIARKKVVIFTPNGFTPQNKHGDDLEEHLSGWGVHEMQQIGYTVFGIYGPKILRGNDYGIRFKPKIFWGIISELLNFFYIYQDPEKATALLCMKKL